MVICVKKIEKSNNKRQQGTMEQNNHCSMLTFVVFVIDENKIFPHIFFIIFASALALFLSSFFLTFYSFFLSEAVFYFILYF